MSTQKVVEAVRVAKADLDLTERLSKATQARNGLREMAAYYRDKADKMEALALRLEAAYREGEGQVPFGVWQQVASGYVDALAHNSKGTTSSLAADIAECAASAAVVHVFEASQ